MSKNEKALQTNKLAGLLERQIGLARRGDYDTLLKLTEQNNLTIEKLKAACTNEKDELKEQIQRLSSLYKELRLILETQKVAAGEQLKHIRRGKSVLGSYRRNLAP